MADERLRTKRELKRLFTDLRKKGITDDMISILIDTLWRDRVNQRTSGFYNAGGKDSVISFDPVTRFFVIAPFNPEEENYEPRYAIFSWANVAVHQRIYYPHSILIPNEEGLFCVYFDKEPDPGSNQILFYAKNPTAQELKTIYASKVLISCFYWDADNDEMIHFGDDRHGSQWNPQMHFYLHTAFRARRKSGLTITGESFGGDGSDNAHAKFSITGGVMLHDDFELKIPSSSESLPILYQEGFFPRFKHKSGYAIYQLSSRACFNTGGAVVAAASGNYVLYHIFATNEIHIVSRTIISVMGSAQYQTLSDAHVGASAELDAINLWMPQQGRFHIETIIVQTDDAYTNDVKSRIVGVIGKTHPPVTIAKNSEELLAITDKQELSIPGEFEEDEYYALKNRNWEKISDYKWNIHSPEQIVGYLTPPANVIATVNGSGTIDETIAAGAIVVTAINEAGETLASNCPAFDILIDTTNVFIGWETVEGAIAYRVYYQGQYFETTDLSLNFLNFLPDTAAELPLENTAAIFQNPFEILPDDTVEFKGLGIGVETEIDGVDPTKKILTLTKQQSDYNEIDDESPNFIPNKPTIPAAQVNSNWNALTGVAKILNKPDPYILPAATQTVLGGIKLGEGLVVNPDGTISVITTFLGLDDVIPESYAGKAWNVPKVTDEEDGLDFAETEEMVTVLAKLTELADCPSSLTGYGGYILRVRLDEQGIEFIAP